jgi:2,4-dienoyl-CoA reductase-like NADH-dependent reductase (Old Yellow Enzyme family)
MHLAKLYAPKAVIFANGGLHNIEQAVAAIDSKDTDIVTIARGALANPDLPKRLASGRDLNEFDPAILGPIANIKDAELVM